MKGDENVLEEKCEKEETKAIKARSKSNPESMANDLKRIEKRSKRKIQKKRR